ncbi:DUF3427 domain-containing protein [Ilumatobacter nonamiensis]|uniref:DUF3427 domain-containing protein n=1 Tax=Ilumatobacter nonamiensis TaxID=467093 RepID=UPI000349102F|nr:DUF3427 domain-containing protein [Ilumatobacter nonamiensis]
MGEVEPGLYESLVTADLAGRLASLEPLTIDRRDLHTAEAPDRIAQHLSRQIERALRDVRDDQRLEVGIAVARDLLTRLSELTQTEPQDLPISPATILHAILGTRPDGTPAPMGSPLIPLLDTTLLTNATGEPSLWNQLISEIESSERIDVVMAFIRLSGIRPLVDALTQHCAAGKSLRILTTIYTGSTERAALDKLAGLGADIRISYDVTTTRLHAKAWVFHRGTGFSTAYIGSSNLTMSAQVTGIEWNVRASGARNPDVVSKFDAVFDSYWSNGDFVDYDSTQFDDHAEQQGRVENGPHVILSPIELRPHPFQERLLELLAVSREKGRRRNLLVSATGTGKTVMAAVDYGRLRQTMSRSRLLFIAHREEILDQSIATFRHALRDATFGEKWVGGARPSRYDHVFASIQSLNAADFDLLEPSHFDVVIVDEFHHAAATSYAKVLDHLQPMQLLGLTATPERSDGLPILHWFDDRIAAELRLWDAIDQQHLAPFVYFGVHDDTDLNDVPWRRGHGYDVTSLSNLYTSNDAWARLVVKQVDDHVEVATMRGLGFCVSVAHAEFMADHFERSGIPAVAVSGETPHDERHQALARLRNGDVSIVFSVDLFNEGVDVPDVDTILMLRPTESPTLFLQQLGRGLRKANDKAFCTVIDFVGTHRREFRFDRRYRALLGGTRRELEQSIERRFPFLPTGCHMNLDRVAEGIVLRSVREAIPTRWPGKVDELRSLRRERPDIDLAEFLHESGLELDDVYDRNRGWSDLNEDAGAPVAPAGPHEAKLRRVVGRLLHVDDQQRLTTLTELLNRSVAPRANRLDIRTRRTLHMLIAPLVDQIVGKNKMMAKDTDLQAATDAVWSHPQVRSELLEVFGLLAERVDHVHRPLETHPDCPLQVHARYTRLEILASLGLGARRADPDSTRAKIPAWQSGVYDASVAGTDLLAFTLDKSGGGFSPTTRYRDYAISRELIHWESQSTTRADSQTGLRYQHHQSMGRSILLFARMRADDRSFWFLGPATYVRHEGERPMAITWKLTHQLPGDLYQEFAAAVA